MKRIFDIFLAIFSIILFIPPFLIIALLIKLTSKGPILFWSKRVGINSKIFLMPKFRSMKAHTPVLATDKLENPDLYITSLGRWLRKTSLDELPQLFSILIGDMSFVGPRPALYSQEVLITSRKELGIDKIRPGLTGWAQINGRDEIDMLDKIAFDKAYIENQSFYFDIVILAITMIRVFRKTGVKH